VDSQWEPSFFVFGDRGNALVTAQFTLGLKPAAGQGSGSGSAENWVLVAVRVDALVTEERPLLNLERTLPHGLNYVRLSPHA
jgi:hypothetical protein